MFLLNSRSPLATKTSHSLKRAGTLYTKDTGLFCRVPLPGLLRDALGYSPRGTCVSSRYEQQQQHMPPFHGHLESVEGAPVPPARLCLLLTITVLHKLLLTARQGSAVHLSGCVRNMFTLVLVQEY